MEAPDQTTTQLWIAAIPSTLLAVSTWYNRHTTKTTVAKSDVKTQEVVDDAAKLTSAEIAALKSRIASLEVKTEETRVNQISIAAKYTETMNVLSAEFGKAKSAFIKMAPKPPTVDVPSTATDVGKVATEETAEQPLGKVVLKP